MSINSYGDINEIHLDVLRELANIGSGNAASSLSTMLGQPVDITIPDINISDYNEAYARLGGAEAIMVGTLLLLSGGLSGMMMLLIPAASACELINMLMFTDIKGCDEIDDIGFSAIGEVANIMSGTFVNAIAEMTGLSIDISPPSSTLDMLGSIMSVPVIYFANISDKLMCVQNELIIMGKKTSASIIMMPDIPSLERLMSCLGIEA